MKLSPKQNEVLALAVEGLTNKEIARLMRIQPETVKTHVRMIIKTTGVRRSAWWKLRPPEQRIQEAKLEIAQRCVDRMIAIAEGQA